MRIEQRTVHDLRSSAECDCLADGFFVPLSARPRKRGPPIVRGTFDTERGPVSVSGRRDPARGPVRQREPECRNIVQWKNGGSDENGTLHQSSRLRRCDIDPGRRNLATDGGSGDGDGLDDGAAVVAAPRRRSLISTWPNVARYHSRFWTGELRNDRCVFPVFRARAVP